MVNKNFQMEIPMKVNIVKANLTVMVYMYGKMELLTKELLWEESVKAWELWKIQKDSSFKANLLINLPQETAR